MARRKKSTNPNIPVDVLERARQNVAIETNGELEKAEAALSVNERSARRRNLTPAQLERSRQRGELTHEMMEEALANPTIEISEETLHTEYGHVLVDLRNMGVLAAILIAVIVALSYVL